MNTEMQLTKGGDKTILEVRDVQRSLIRLMMTIDDNPALAWNRANTILVDVGWGLFDHQRSSLFEIAQRYTDLKKSFNELLITIAEFEQYVREFVARSIPEAASVVRVFLQDDRDRLVFEFTYPEEEIDVFTFEQYLERSRREGEKIHPEIERQLRYFRSIIPKKSLQLPDLRNRRSRNRDF